MTAIPRRPTLTTPEGFTPYRWQLSLAYHMLERGHLACAAALAVLEVMEEQNLMGNAAALGASLSATLAKTDGLLNVRGRGLMIGFDVEEGLKDLRKNLLWKHHIFTGEAKPAVIRLLPSLALTFEEASQFTAALTQEVTALHSTQNP